jgi:hypothetical protein
VNASGTTQPWACRCNRSSPIAEAVCIAASTSPGSINCHFSWVRFAQTPARQSAWPCPSHVVHPAHGSKSLVGSEHGGRSHAQSHRPGRTGRFCCQHRTAKTPLQILEEARSVLTRSNFDGLSRCHSTRARLSAKCFVDFLGAVRLLPQVGWWPRYSGLWLHHSLCRLSVVLSHLLSRCSATR